MPRVILPAVLLILLADYAQAGVMLGTSNAPGTPLVVSPGTTSGSFFVTVVGNGTPNDMADWQFRLVIVPDAGATGTLTFKDPTTGAAPNPTNYVFDGHGAGIVATNSNGGLQLDANDFDNNNGTVVSTSGANLLRVDFLASSNASGLFGIYAVRGSAFTLWDDGLSPTNPQFFTNVPSGSGMVRIGDVRVLQAASTSVPEPSALALFGLGSVAVVAWRRRKFARCAG